MKFNKKITTAFIALPLLACSFSSFAMPQKAQHFAHVMSMKIFLKDVDLTPEQKAQLKDIRKTAREKNKAKREENKAQRQAQREASALIVMAPKFDEAAARKLAQEMSFRQIEKRVENMRNQNKMFNILTPEQQKQVVTNVDNLKKKVEEKMK